MTPSVGPAHAQRRCGVVGYFTRRVVEVEVTGRIEFSAGEAGTPFAREPLPQEFNTNFMCAAVGESVVDRCDGRLRSSPVLFRPVQDSSNGGVRPPVGLADLGRHAPFGQGKGNFT